jgi:predicted Ser/Thr protein kinase
MKAYDYWLADKYLEHVCDEHTINLLKDKRQLDTITDDLDLHMTYRYLLWRDFAARAHQFRDYPGMHDHMLLLSEYVKNGQEELALKAIEPKASGFRNMMIQKTQNKWRR